jgi:hypothetical protein
MTTVRTLEAAAIRAHERGVSFNNFWAANQATIRDAVSRDRFQGFYKRLFCLVLCGNLDGQEPIGSLECGWERDDENSKPDDAKTAAKWQGTL